MFRGITIAPCGVSVRPHGAFQFLVGDQLAVVLHKIQEDVKGLFAERNDLAITCQ